MNGCLSCDICCRFPLKESPWAPVFLDEEVRTAVSRGIHPKYFRFKNSRISSQVELSPHRDGFVCPCFLPDENTCKIYEYRPLDCRLYPYVIMFDASHQKVLLGLDDRCPHPLPRPDIPSPSQCERLIMPYQKDIAVVKELTELTRLILKRPLGLKRLGPEAPIYIWSDIMNLFYKDIGNQRLIFAEENGHYFLPEAPKVMTEELIRNAVQIMDSLNKRGNFSSSASGRIELIGVDYICERKAIVELKGNRFKNKRALYNYFVQHNEYVYGEFRPEYIFECLNLFLNWADERKATYNDPYYHALLDDSYFAFRRAMRDYSTLGLIGRIVKVNHEIKACTLGYPSDGETFNVLFEIADLKVKGLPQFIFREFCREMASYKYINLMDDSGLENLKRAKLSYHPARLEPKYTIR